MYINIDQNINICWQTMAMNYGLLWITQLCKMSSKVKLCITVGLQVTLLANGGTSFIAISKFAGMTWELF